MKNFSKISKGAILILLCGLLLAACSGGAPATPTTDPNMLFTQVAETVMVSITQTAVAMPTNTPVPTDTPIPTPIPIPTQDMSAYPTIAPIPGSTYPTATVQHYGNAAQWYGQSPADGQTYKAYQKFTFHGCMRNIGDTIWNTNFYLKYVSGPNLWNVDSWRVGNTVKPGGVWCWDFNPGTMPGTKGANTTRIYFYSDKNQFMGEVYFYYIVSG